MQNLLIKRSNLNIIINKKCMKILSRDEYLQTPKQFRSRSKYMLIYFELAKLQVGEAIQLEKSEYDGKGSFATLANQYFENQNTKKKFNASKSMDGSTIVVRIK
jgi:hypothetical protein